MVLRWTAAGMLNAERSFRRIKGYKQMPSSSTPSADTPPKAASDTEPVGAAA
jgi:putative transposase